MKDQHEKISGYRSLTQEEIDLMNEAKALSELWGIFVSKLRTYPDANKPELHVRSGPAIDQRWVAIGATDIQKGVMAIIRGIAQPTTF